MHFYLFSSVSIHNSWNFFVNFDEYILDTVPYDLFIFDVERSYQVSDDRVNHETLSNDFKSFISLVVSRLLCLHDIRHCKTDDFMKPATMFLPVFNIAIFK